jgi:cysteine-rich repeat protein
MKKTAKMTAVAAVALLSGAVAVNCSTSSKTNSGATGPDGMLSLALTLPSGVTISQVSYTIHSAQPTNAPADKTGTIDVSNGMAMASVETSYPSSSNDTVALTATTSNGEPCTGSSSMPFNVLSGQQSGTMVTLTCGLLTPDGGPGSVVISGMVVDNTDICPVLNSWSVSPLTTGPTGSINLASMASDGDAADAATLTYAWTVSPATPNAFANAAAASTTFTCPGTGNFALTLTIDDHHMPTHCTATRTFQVACGLCGNGVKDPGEDCDDAASFANNTCDKNTCKAIPIVCGNGLIQPGEQCDDTTSFNNNTCGKLGGTPAGANNACQTIPVACGNGLVQPGEQCEPPNTATCDATCQTISACLVCEKTGTACLGTTASAGAAYGCQGLGSATDIANCTALKACLEQHPNCSNPANIAPATKDPTACFCGSMDASTCSGADPTMVTFGPCASAYFALYAGGATKANVPNVLGDFFAKATPTGMANNLYACDVKNNCQSMCP